MTGWKEVGAEGELSSGQGGGPYTSASSTSAMPAEGPSLSSDESSQAAPPAPLFSRLQTLVTNTKPNPLAGLPTHQSFALAPPIQTTPPIERTPPSIAPESSASAKGKGKAGPPTPPTPPVTEDPAEQARLTGGRPFIKIRFLTWNMHDAIPKGDLTPLLGKVTPYCHPDTLGLEPGQVPPLALDNEHPYHLIVVAGQECPTPSGLPMGLGAGLKWGKQDTSMPSTPMRAPPNSPFGPQTGSQTSQASLPLPPPPISTAQSATIPAASLSLPPVPSTSTPSPSPSSATPPPLVPSSSQEPVKEHPTLTLQVENLTTLPAPATTLLPPVEIESPASVAAASKPSPSDPSTWLGVPAVKVSAGTPPSAVPAALPTDKLANSQTGTHLGDKEKEREREKQKHHHHLRTPGTDGKGWTDVLTDWLANRVGEGSTSGPRMPRTAPVEAEGTEEGPPTTEFVIEDEGPAGKEGTTAAGTSRYRVVQEGRGTYELLVKERLLGIYLSVYVWKGCRQLVRSTSTSYVTTGLVGGRFGNKGGVGCSVHLGSTRLLFINSHLAAHASRSDVRLLNVSKIKAELDIDSFLESGDERLLNEDPTDRFDSTFWVGDLNFRLDISRIHADWLVAKRDYAQALKFDQLKKIMDEGLGFQGFKEADITFAPTYKYDVDRAIKRSTTRSSRRKARDPSLSEVQEAHVIEEADDDLEDGGSVEEGDADRASINSSGWTSVAQSTFTSDDEDVDSPAPPSSFPQQSHELAGKVIEETKKIFLPSTAIKAKKKLLGFIKMPSSPSTSAPPSRSVSNQSRRPSNSPSETPRSTSGSGSLDLDRATSAAMSSTPPTSHGGFVSPIPPSPPRASVDGSPPRPQLSRKLSARLRRSFSGRDGPNGRFRPDSDDDSEDSDDPNTAKQGVYDTSSKKRVPSWCDRILWKTFETDYPEPLPLPPTTPIASDEPHPFTRLNRIASALHIRRRNSREVKRSTSVSSQLSSHQLASPRGSIVSTTGLEIGSIPMTPGGSGSAHVHWGTGSSSIAARNSRQRSGSLGTMVHNAGAAFTPPSSTSASPTRQPHGSSLAHAPPPPDHPSRTVTSPPTSHPGSPIDSPRPMAQRFTSEPIQQQLQPQPEQQKGSWFTRLLSIHPSAPAAASAPELGNVVAGDVGPPMIKRRKGEVLPLHYGTLSDQEMRTIQGFSDHRPVIGVMAVFI